METKDTMMSMLLSAVKIASSLCLYMVVYGLVIYFVLQGCYKSYVFCYQIFGSVGMQNPGEDVQFQVEEGDTMRSLSKKLEDKGLIKDSLSFYIRTQIMDEQQTKLRAGTYILNTHMDYEEIINQLTVSS